MAVISELIQSESDGTLSFGDYTLEQKSKVSGFEFQGDSYKVKLLRRLQNWKKMNPLYMNLYRVRQYII